MNISTGEWQGFINRLVKKIHIAAYQQFPDVNFVIHTHQTYASAIGLAGYEQLDITAEKGNTWRRHAGKLWPSRDKADRSCKVALQDGAKVVLMANHGVLICGSSQDETMDKAMLLEDLQKKYKR